MHCFFELEWRRFSSGREVLSFAVHRVDPGGSDDWLAAGFPGRQTKVAVISVDTAGREVRIPAQEGICVQWR
jgi:uncharacterized OB-fold protein